MFDPRNIPTKYAHCTLCRLTSRGDAKIYGQRYRQIGRLIICIRSGDPRSFPNFRNSRVSVSLWLCFVTSFRKRNWLICILYMLFIFSVSSAGSRSSVLLHSLPIYWSTAIPDRTPAPTVANDSIKNLTWKNTPTYTQVITSWFVISKHKLCISKSRLRYFEMIFSFQFFFSLLSIWNCNSFHDVQILFWSEEMLKI